MDLEEWELDQGLEQVLAYQLKILHLEEVCNNLFISYKGTESSSMLLSHLDDYFKE